MRKISITLVLIIYALNSIAQTEYKIGFSSDTMSIIKNRENVLKEILVETNNIKDSSLNGYSVSLEVDYKKSTLPATDYEIYFPSKQLSKLSDKEPIYFKLLKDEVNDRERTLVINIKISKPDTIPDSNAKNIADNKQITLAVLPYSRPLENFKHLAYIGTNFDLVNGIRAKNLFFATNFFMQKHATGKGFNLSIYGNRAFTLTDTSVKLEYPSKTVGRGDSSLVYRSRADVVRNRSTDNIGAYFSFLMPVWRKGRPKHSFDIYYSPGCEFIWRRTTIHSEYQNVILLDSSYTQSPLQEGVTLETPTIQEAYQNIFDVNYLLASFTIAHETEDISIRVRLAAGYNSYFTPVQTNANPFNTEYNSNHDISFLGKAWITEATTGITVQVEIYNRLFNPQPYYGATLSKAINFKDLGTIVQPLSKRN